MALKMRSELLSSQHSHVKLRSRGEKNPDRPKESFPVLDCGPKDSIGSVKKFSTTD